MLTVDNVRAALGLDPADTADDEWLGVCVAAVNDYVARLPVVVDSIDPSVWTPDVTLGATLLAQHEYKLRGTGTGAAMFDQVGGWQPSYPPAEVARFLQLRSYRRPQVTGLA